MPDVAVPSTVPGRAILEATAPVRIADCGGWTDTWFAKVGLVCSIAVEPGIRVRLLRVATGAATSRLTIRATGKFHGHPVVSETVVEVEFVGTARR